MTLAHDQNSINIAEVAKNGITGKPSKFEGMKTGIFFMKVKKEWLQEGPVKDS